MEVSVDLGTDGGCLESWDFRVKTGRLKNIGI